MKCNLKKIEHITDIKHDKLCSDICTQMYRIMCIPCEYHSKCHVDVHDTDINHNALSVCIYQIELKAIHKARGSIWK